MVSTPTFPNRLGKGANLYLASAELAVVASIMGKIPALEEYPEDIDTIADDVYRYPTFNEMVNYPSAANKAFPVMVTSF